MKPLEKDNVELYFEEMGSGEPILFVHGLGSNTYTWKYLTPDLSMDHRLILIDLKGFGKSPKPADRKYSVHDQASLIYEFIVKHDFNNITLIGHSFGGGVALITALYLKEKRSTRLKRLVLIDAAAYDQYIPGFIKLLATPIIGSIIVSTFPTKFQVLKILKLSYYDTNKITDDIVSAYEYPLNMPRGKGALIQTAKQIIPSDINEIKNKYNEINIPTLIIWGEEDNIIPLILGMKLHDAIPSSKIEIIKMCGHIPQEERPVETLGLIKEFLQEK